MKASPSIPRRGLRQRFGPPIASAVVAILVGVAACESDSPTTPDSVTDSVPEPPVTDSIPEPPPLGEGLGAGSSSWATDMFKSAASSAVGTVSSTGVGWAMSAIGLSAGSPDYTNQLDSINQSLQTIIGQLNNVEQELTDINNSLVSINCSTWASSLSAQKGRITHLQTLYTTHVGTAQSGGIVTDSVIQDWVDQVLAQGAYTGQTSMGEILSQIATQVYVPPSDGVIPACIKKITVPTTGWGADTTYYSSVKLYTDYYFAYQVKGLALLTEALHHNAWVAAGSPTSESLQADSVSAICQSPFAKDSCNLAASEVNAVYNALHTQLTSAGAPYTDEHIILQLQGSWMWPKSLEEFNVAAGSDCTEPLISAHPCGRVHGRFDGQVYHDVVYRGYADWERAGNNLLGVLLADWSTGTAGDFLENERGFENMRNKVVIGTHPVTISLKDSQDGFGNSAGTQYVVPFFDTDWDHSFLGGGPALTTAHFNILAPVKKTTESTICDITFNVFEDFNYSTGSGVPANRNGFYDLSARARKCGNNYTTQFNFTHWPGWLASQAGDENHGGATWQYRWPVKQVPLKPEDCTQGRAPTNAGGFWTMCRDDFTNWLQTQVPRPATCDNLAAVQCVMSADSVSAAVARVAGRSHVAR